jgi:hypothetical protein
MMGLERREMDLSKVAGHGRSISSHREDSWLETPGDASDSTRGVSSFASTSGVLPV